MKSCLKCNKKLGLLDKKQYINDKLVCSDCYSVYQENLKKEQMEMEAQKQKEENERLQREKERFQKMDITELIRNLGNTNENEKINAMKELAKREDVKAINALWEAINLEGGIDFDWRYDVLIDNLPIIGNFGNDDALKWMIKFKVQNQKLKEETVTALNQAYISIENYKNNPNPAPEATEAYNDIIRNLDGLTEINQKIQNVLNLLDDAINKLKSKKFEKMADRVENNLDGMNWQEFEDSILNALNGERMTARVGDKGIDGLTKDGTPIQIKQSSNIGRNVVDNFETAIRRYFSGDEKNRRGIIVAFSFTKGAYDEIIRAKDEDNIDIQLITADELVN